jgi:hypothetical protein
MRFPFLFDPFSFLSGFVIAGIFWWMVARARPAWQELSRSFREQQETAQSQRTSSVEENHRRMTLRRAQGMHLAAPFFALDEILLEPRLLAPPPHVEPDGPLATENVVTQTLPYLPTWPELAAIYRAPTLTLGEALSGGQNLVILGQAGAGKTVALAHLATQAANRSEGLGGLSEWVPFLVHIADLRLPVHDPKEVLNPLIDALSEHASVLDLGRIPSFVQTTFRSGRALFLVDGYDELTFEGQQVASEYLKLVLQAYPKTRIVTTGAPEQLDGVLGLGFAPLALIGWNTEDARTFTQHWGELWSQFVAREAWAQTGPNQVDPVLLNAWLASDNRGLTPFELTLKVWGAYAGDSLGPHVLEAIATHVRRLAPGNTPLAALEMLAMQIVLTAQPIFDPRKAREWVRKFEPSEEAELVAQEEEAAPEPETENRGQKEKAKPKKARLNAPAPSTGLLGKMASTGLIIAHPHNRMRFAHPVIGGFLAGRALSGFAEEEVLVNQPDWSGKLLAMRYLAAHGDATRLTQKMLEWSRLPMHRPLLAAARWLRDAPREAPWRGKLMAALAGLLQTEGLPLALRGQALAALVCSNDPGVPAVLRQLMSGLSFELVRLAALGSGALQDLKSIPALQNALEAPSITARQAACLALVSIGTNDALEIVARVLLSADEDLRRSAAEALANERAEGHAMLKDGASMKDILVRRAVVYGLGRVDEPWAIEALQKMQVADDQWVVRNSAAEIIDGRNQLNNPRVPRPLRPPSESPWLLEFAGTQGVGIAPGAPATDVLLAALKSESEERRLGALAYLKRAPSDGVITQIYHAMYGDDPELRESAFYALWEIGAAGQKLPHPSQFGFG